uniref:Uncharacterized protein n=1 Tax=Romanomermis culicivorax TaxID=13658 RepID=A0A915L3A0_ROMCU
MAAKRKNLYRKEYSKDFDGIKKSREGETLTFCSYCSSDIDIGSTVAQAIMEYMTTFKKIRKKICYPGILGLISGLKVVPCTRMIGTVRIMNDREKVIDWQNIQTNNIINH